MKSKLTSRLDEAEVLIRADVRALTNEQVIKRQHITNIQRVLRRYPRWWDSNRGRAKMFHAINVISAAEQVFNTKRLRHILNFGRLRYALGFSRGRIKERSRQSQARESKKVQARINKSSYRMRNREQGLPV